MVVALVAGAFGGIGAMGRYLADMWVSLGTLLINVSGSLLLGVLTGLVWYHGASGNLKLVLGTGFCGGLTTWSTATFESFRLIEERRFASAGLYVGGGLVLALAAASVGIALAGVL
jgi:CrcB protein